MIPSVGRIVHITISEAMAEEIDKNKNLRNTQVYFKSRSSFEGNPVESGDIYPMIITKVWSDEPIENTLVQGQIFLDGNYAYWASSVKQGTENGQWFEPPKV